MADSDELARKLAELIHARDGITDRELKDEVSKIVQITEVHRLNLLNDLKTQGCLRVWKTAKGEIAYGYQDPEIGRLLAKMDSNDNIVYQLIKDSRSKGIAKNDLKHKSGMNQKLLGASLKNLDKFGLIKSIKAKDKNRWVYFTADQEPDADVVGGKFYMDGQINDDKIDHLRAKIVGLVESKGRASITDIVKYLVDSSEEARDLREEEIQTVVNTLVFDDVLEDAATLARAEYVLSRNKTDSLLFSGIRSVPCFTCPVFFECKPGGNISPETCVYFEDW
jgi:DNA-directed RNA polymerase III subunit RPC6